MIGKKFGLLTVLKYSHSNKYKSKIWECICDCGGTTKVSTNALNMGHYEPSNCRWSTPSEQRRFQINRPKKHKKKTRFIDDRFTV